MQTKLEELRGRAPKWFFPCLGAVTGCGLFLCYVANSVVDDYSNTSIWVASAEAVAVGLLVGCGGLLEGRGSVFVLSDTRGVTRHGRLLPYKQMTGFAWIREAGTPVLLLFPRRGPALAAGVPDDGTAPRVESILAERNIPKVEAEAGLAAYVEKTPPAVYAEPIGMIVLGLILLGTLVFCARFVNHEAERVGAERQRVMREFSRATTDLRNQGASAETLRELAAAQRNALESARSDLLGPALWFGVLMAGAFLGFGLAWHFWVRAETFRCRSKRFGPARGPVVERSTRSGVQLP